MIYGLSGATVSKDLPYGIAINDACAENDFPPPLAYAIAYRETIKGEIQGLWPSAADVVSSDFGYGLFQLTAPFQDIWPPPQWRYPYCNADDAIHNYLAGLLKYWAHQGFVEEALVKLTAASYNEGLTAARTYHAQGDVDAGTTDHYGEAVLQYYLSLEATGKPE